MKPDPPATGSRAAKKPPDLIVNRADKAAREYLAQYADQPGYEEAVTAVRRWTAKLMQIAEWKAQDG
jgi:hypothetical protein